ncbi:DUF4267 domain-containing protein [Micromonospora sp. U21]|nr:DUF4267 domain-containing protein [Micromonospora sp. U21]MBQ0902716.1 DUF4267 domain-containing protein [Micromonospora sp. U21]
MVSPARRPRTGTSRPGCPSRPCADIASGLFILILLAGATPHLLGWFMLAATGIPVGDALIVLRSNGPKSAVYGIHGATAAVMLAISVLLLVA